MLNEFSIAFMLGIFVGAVITFFIRDLIKVFVYHWRAIIFQPRYLKESLPPTSNNNGND